VGYLRAELQMQFTSKIKKIKEKSQISKKFSDEVERFEFEKGEGGGL
jgi:hypothetical protein